MIIRCPLKNVVVHWSDNSIKGLPTMLAMRAVTARVIQYFGSQYQSVTAEVEKVWEYRMGGRSDGRVYEKLPVWHGFCCAGTISLPHKKIHCPARKVYWKSKDIHMRVVRYSREKPCRAKKKIIRFRRKTRNKLWRHLGNHGI